MSLRRSTFASLACLAVFVLSLGCTGGGRSPLSVDVDVRNQQDDQAWIEVKPLHYKYSPKERWPIGKGERVQTALNPNVHQGGWLVLRLGSEEYELPKVSEGTLLIEADAGLRPAVTNVVLNGEPLRDYLRWLTDDQSLGDSLRRMLPDFRKGDTEPTVKLARNRFKLADRAFDGTDLEHIAHRLLGEYLVKSLEAVSVHARLQGFDYDEAEKARRQVMRDARRYNFFTLDVLKAQRAGSRDFTYTYANTFVDFDALRSKHGEHLLMYDLQRIAYPVLDSAKTDIAGRISSADGKAFTLMHVVAERLGDAPFAVAEPGYLDWMAQYADKYPEWADFLRMHYEGVKRVAPGQEAIAFRLEDADGETHTMGEYRGKYVLLDFWANWCGPCLEEFPAMRRLYAKYSREDFEIVGISIDLDRNYWLQMLPQHANPWPQLWGGEQFEQETFKAYRGGGIPFYVLVDRDGNILRYNDVRATYNLESVMDSLLARE